MRISIGVLAAMAALGLLGCGGSGGGNASGGGGLGEGTPMTFGDFQTRAVTAGPLEAITASGGGPVFTGIAGGAFSSIVLAPTPNIDQTNILFDRNGYVFSIKPDGSDLHRVTSEFAGGTVMSHPTWSPDGRRIAFVKLDGGYAQIVVANADGSNAKDISIASASESEPAWRPTGDRIAFSRWDPDIAFSQIFVRNPDGSGIARLSDKSHYDFEPAWSPDGSKIVFTRYDYSVSKYQLYVMSAAGGSAHLLAPSFTGFDMRYASWSPDGQQICFLGSSGSSNYMFSIRPDGTDYKVILSSSATNYYAPSFSPDSKSIVYSKLVSGTNKLFIVGTEGGSERQLTDANISDIQSAWSPFPGKRTLVGSGGVFGSSAAGFLYGQDHDGVKSVLAFGSGSPLGTSVRTGDTAPGAAFVVYQIDGSLNSIKFFNGLSTTTTVLPSGSLTSATGALVSFDTVTGYVSSVVPFTASRGTSVTQSQQGATRVYKGDFLGVYDAQGKNLAPGGAHEVGLETKSGKATVRG